MNDTNLMKLKLQVTWDEPDLLQNVKRVSPWLVELASNMPPIHLSAPFSPPRKKLRFSQHPDYAFDGQLHVPTFSNSNFLVANNIPFGGLPESTPPAGMQGARHAHYSLSSLQDLHLNKLQSGLFPASFQPLDHTAAPIRFSSHPTVQKPSTSENVSCLLSMTNRTESSKKLDEVKPPKLVLFGQTIITGQHNSPSCSKVTNFSDESGSALLQQNLPERFKTEANLETGHCKVFMESEDVGRTMDLSLLGSYDELYRKLADMFGIEKSEMPSHVRYRDTTGAVKLIGDEPFR